MAASDDNDQEFESEHHVLREARIAAGDSVFLIGQTGTGKSSIANAVFNLNQECDGKDRVFKESADVKSCTEDLSVHRGHWFGDETAGDVTVIDTPGLLDSEDRSAQFLLGLMTMVKHFPRQRLRLILVPLPLTSQKADSTFQDMLKLIDNLLRPDNGVKVWKHVVFIFTCANLLNNDPDNLHRKRDGWKQYLESRGIDDPLFCDFDYGNPRSLEPLRTRFNDLPPYTPEATTELVNFLRDNPAATLKDHMEKSKRWRDMKDEATKKLEDLNHKNAQTIQRLAQLAHLSKMQERQLQTAREREEKLHLQLEDLRFQDEHHHHHDHDEGTGSGSTSSKNCIDDHDGGDGGLNAGQSTGGHLLTDASVAMRPKRQSNSNRDQRRGDTKPKPKPKPKPKQKQQQPWEQQFNEQQQSLSASEEVITQLQQLQERSDEQEQQLSQAKIRYRQLQSQVDDLRRQQPSVIVVHEQRHHHKGCLVM